MNTRTNTTWLSLVLLLPLAAVAQNAPICHTPDGNPITLGDMTTYGEAFAADGAWPLELDANDFVNSEAPLAKFSWVLDKWSDDFEDGAAGWTALEGTWGFEEANPISGARSFAQTNAGPSRTRNLFNRVFDGDLEIEFTVRMLGGQEEIQLLLGAQNYWENYEVILRGRGLSDMLLYRRVRDSASQRVDANLPSGHPAFPIDRDIDYRVKVTHIGSTISGYVNGVRVFSHTDTQWKRGKIGLSTYRTPAIFDDLTVRVISDDEVATHTFDEGVHFLELETENSVRQSVNGIVPIRTVRGEAPTANVVGPLVVDEFSGAAARRAFTTTLDGTGSTDPEDSVLHYDWDLGVDTFDGTNVREGEWVTGGNVTQSGGKLRLTGSNSWGQTYAYTRENFARAKGLKMEATVTSPNSMMVGWKRNNGTATYTQYDYALYFASGTLRVYQRGSSTAYLGGYDRNKSYDVQIELKAAGAIYRIRETGTPTWRQVWETDAHSDANYRKGLDVYNGAVTFDNLRRHFVGAQPTVRVHGLGQVPVNLTVIDPAGSTSQAATTLSIVGNDPPVADAGPDQVLDETNAVRGVWTVSFDASGSSDDHGIDYIEWDFAYDPAVGFQPSGKRGTTVNHPFPGPASYTVAARVFDHAGQSHVDSMTLTLTLGDPPSANAGGPYSFDEFTGEAVGGGFLVTLDGTGSTDAESALRYSWRLTPDTFPGDRVNERQFHSAGAVNDGAGLVVTGNGNWGQRYVVTQDTFARTQGTMFEARFNPVNGASFMVGWKNTNTSFSYTQFYYAVYFANGQLRVYEGGSNRGDIPGDYQRDVEYDVRIELKPGSGAWYYLKRADEQAWTLIYDSNYSSANSMKRGMTVSSGSPRFISLTDVMGGAQPSWRVFNTGQRDVEVTVHDQGDQSASASTTLTLLPNAPPVANAGPDQGLGELLARRGEFPVSLDGTGTTDDHGIFRYEWDLDYDGQTFDVDASGATPDLTLLGPGARNIALRVTDHALQTHLDTVTVVLGTGAGPVADAGADITTEGKWPVLLDARGSTDDVGIDRFVWDFGDGQTGKGAEPQHIYWALGEYTATLTVLDRANQSDTDTVIVESIVAAPPVANAGGPYGGSAGGKPAYFDGRGSTDDYGIVTYWWDVDVATDSDGDGDPTNDRDLQGPRPMFVYANPGAYTAQLTVIDGADQSSTDTTVVTVDDSHGPDVIAVPWRGNDPLARHEIINNRSTRLKGVVRAAGALTYQWDFGDGSAPTAVAAVGDKRAVEATHTYPDSPENTPFTATLRVWDAQGRMGEDQYYLIVKPDDLDTRTNISIDEGLWYLHKIQNAAGWWRVSSHGTHYASSTASALQALLINSHRLDGDNSEDPFVDTVNRGFKNLTTRLIRQSVPLQEGRNPDSNGNGDGVRVNAGRYTYEGGMVMDAIAATQKPLWIAETGSTGIKGRYFHVVLQDMADAYAYGQNESGNGRGSWEYRWNAGRGDNSAAQWAGIGLLAAEESFGITIPQFVKDQNLKWMKYSHNGAGFGYAGAGNGVNTTPSGMVQLAMDDVNRWEPIWQAAEAEMTRRFLWQYRDYYGLFAFTKAMRLANPEPIETLAGGIDWYSDPVKSVRQRITDDMVKSGSSFGSWRVGSWGDRTMHTAWAVIMLTPTLFVQPPVADAGDDIIWAYGTELTFDASRSFHTDAIRSIVLYEWDFDGDGTYDLATNDPRDPRAKFTYADPNPDQDGDPPVVVNVKLRVTDNNVPAQNDIDLRKVTIAEPPHAPFARAGGPYVVTAGVPVALDGSASFDLDPGDSISLYEWDLDDDGVFFDDVDVSTDQPQILHVFAQPGLYDIGLRVKDRGVFNPVGCEVGVDCLSLESAPDFTRVRVIANVAPVADTGGPYEVFEGTTLTLDATGTVDENGDALTYEWDLGDDGTVDFDGEEVDYEATDDAVLDLRLTVSDGALSDSLTTTITVLNVAPVVDAGPDVVQPNGLRIVSGGAFADPGADTWEATVDYGDNSGAQPLALNADKTFTLDHTYAQAGQYIVTIIVRDDDGGEGIAQALFEVTNTQPIVMLGDDLTEAEGTAINRVGTFADPDDNNWTATVNYGDGGADQALALNADKTFTLDHVYADDGQYTVRVTIDDNAGGVAADELVVTVTNVAPDPDAGPDATLDEGGAFAHTGSFSDPGADTWEATVDYGDGGGAVPLALAADKTFDLNHTYADDGEYTVTVTVTDDDGGEGTDTVLVTVRNVAPAGEEIEDQTIDEGGTASAEVAFSDPGADTHTATVDWDDGNGPQELELDADGEPTPISQTFLDDGVHNVVVTITDDDGGEGTIEFTVTVNNVAPTVDAGDDRAGDEGAQVPMLFAFTDPGADTWDASVDYGDGTPAAALPGVGLDPVAHGHTYRQNGTYRVTVTVTDDDGGVGQDTFDVVVANVAPDVQLADFDAECAENLDVAASFSDPGLDDVHSGSFAWGDGTPDTAAQIDLVASQALASHVYTAVGDYPLQATVRDEDGGETSAQSTVSVVDTTDPTILCPPDVDPDADAQCLAQVDLPAEFADTCDPLVALEDDRLDNYPLGDTTVTFVATDASGNSSQCTTTVTVVDRTAPTANAGEDQLDVEASPQCDVAVLLDGSASADNCGIVSWEWTEGAAVIGAAAEIVPTITGVGDHTIGLAVCDAAGNCTSDEVIVRLERSRMTCHAVEDVNLKLPGIDDDSDSGSDDGSSADDSDSGSGDENGNHLFVKGAYGFNDCSVVNLVTAGGYVKVDDQRYDIPAGGFKAIGGSGKYRYRHPKVGKFWWEITIDTRKGEYDFKAHKQATEGLTPGDGLLVELRLGDQVARETVLPTPKGSKQKEWRYKNKQATCEAPDDDSSSDDGSSDDDSSSDDGSSDDGSSDDGSSDDSSSDHDSGSN